MMMMMMKTDLSYAEHNQPHMLPLSFSLQRHAYREEEEDDDDDVFSVLCLF